MRGREALRLPRQRTERFLFPRFSRAASLLWSNRETAQAHLRGRNSRGSSRKPGPRVGFLDFPAVGDQVLPMASWSQIRTFVRFRLYEMLERGNTDTRKCRPADGAGPPPRCPAARPHRRLPRALSARGWARTGAGVWPPRGALTWEAGAGARGTQAASSGVVAASASSLDVFRSSPP